MTFVKKTVQNVNIYNLLFVFLNTYLYFCGQIVILGQNTSLKYIHIYINNNNQFIKKTREYLWKENES